MRSLIVDNYVINVPVIEILRRLQIALSNGKLKDIKDGSENILVTCPDHDGGQESHPACNIYIGNDSDIPYGYYNCFVCSSHGNFLKFVAHCFDSSEEYAKKWLTTTFKSEIFEKKTYFGEPLYFGPKKRTISYLNESILDQYQTWTPYLGQRKLSRETCERFKVKYDPYYRQVLFPTYDLRGKLVMIPKRSIDTKTFYLDKEIEKPVYCLNYIVENNFKTAVITEGPFDCLTGWEYGIPTCATFGQISDVQIEQLRRSGIRILYSAFDNDYAGQMFTRTLRAKLGDDIIIVPLTFPNGKKDLNDLSKEEFLKMLADASKY